MKTIFLCSILAVCLALAPAAGAQTVVTNWIQAAANFREVNGKLYNVDRSTNWVTLAGDVVQIVPGGLLVDSYKEKPEAYWVPPVSNNGNFLGAGAPGYWRYTGVTNRIEEKTILVRHFPVDPKPVTGSRIRFKAIRAGTFDWGTDVLEAWDFGMPHLVPVLKTNLVTAGR